MKITEGIKMSEVKSTNRYAGTKTEKNLIFRRQKGRL